MVESMVESARDLARATLAACCASSASPSFPLLNPALSCVGLSPPLPPCSSTRGRHHDHDRMRGGGGGGPHGGGGGGGGLRSPMDDDDHAFVSK